jgi:hypothetical protein
MRAGPNDWTMTRAALILAIGALLALVGWDALAGQVVDRVVARVEGDILLLSDLRELGQFQQLGGTQPEAESKRLEELIEQWIIEREAKIARFDQPNGAEVDTAVLQMQKTLGGEPAFAARMKEFGLTISALRRLVRRELYFSRYLDYKFRPAVQVDETVEKKYFDEELAPALVAHGEKVPPLDSVREQIHELLVQRDISARADQWLTESRTRLKVEFFTLPGTSGGNPPEIELKLHQ